MPQRWHRKSPARSTRSSSSQSSAAWTPRSRARSSWSAASRCSAPKSRTQPGENRVLKASFRLDFGALQHAANCTKLVAAMLGIDVASQNDGPVKDAEADWFINDQPGSGGSGALANPVRTMAGGGASATKTSTDERGETRAGLRESRSGSSTETRRRTRATSSSGCRSPSTRTTCARILPGLIGAGVTGNVIAAISGALDHMGLFTATKTIQVKDWYADYLVDFSSAEVLRPTPDPASSTTSTRQSPRSRPTPPAPSAARRRGTTRRRTARSPATTAPRPRLSEQPLTRSTSSTSTPVTSKRRRALSSPRTCPPRGTTPTIPTGLTTTSTTTPGSASSRPSTPRWPARSSCPCRASVTAARTPLSPVEPSRRRSRMGMGAPRSRLRSPSPPCRRPTTEQLQA